MEKSTSFVFGTGKRSRPARRSSGKFRYAASDRKKPGGKIHILMDRQNSQKFSEILRRFRPALNEGIVEYDTQSVNFVFELKQMVERGEFVGLLGDRIAAVSARGSRRVNPALFLGETAFFPRRPIFLRPIWNVPSCCCFA